MIALLLLEYIFTINRCDLYVLYTNEPDSSLHATDMTDKLRVQEIIADTEEQISLLKSTLGTFGSHTSCI